MKNKNLIISACLTIALLLIMACNKNENPENKLMEQRVFQLNNMDKYGAQQVYESFSIACADLQEVTEIFSQTINQENLTIVQNQWKTVGKLFKKCEFYDIGAVNSNYIQYRIHRWPIATAVLQDTIHGDTPISTDYIANLGSHIIGIGALEYLLYETDIENNVVSFQDDSRRLDYLLETVRYLKIKADEMQTIWNNYSPDFVLATESRISGGQNQMTNVLLAYLEETIKLRLGKALGEETGGLIDHTLLEAPLSNTSLDFIKSGFEEWKVYFSGDFPNSVDNYGFDDYLIALDSEPLVTTIYSAVTDCDVALQQLVDLNTDIINNTDKVNNLKDAFQTLAVLIKTDLASVIGVTITVNDSDGD